MTEKKFKTKDMIIAVFCTLITILCIVFYFLPAINVKHSASPGGLETDYAEIDYSAWHMTRAAFSSKKHIGDEIAGLTYLKDVYAFPIILAGMVMPLGIICSIVTTVFAFLSWLKNEDFKKFCFLFGLLGMTFTTITIVANWFIAIQVRTGNIPELMFIFNSNVKGSMAYASFVSLILSFVLAIIGCAYNYFLDNFDDEDEDEEDDEEDDEEEEEEVKKPRAKSPAKTPTKTQTKTSKTKA